MIAEIDIDNDNKIVQRTLRGEIDINQALKLVQNISRSVNLHQGYNILVDMRDTAFHPGMVELLEIAAECSRKLIGFKRKIAFIIPDTMQRRQVAKLFQTCMEAEGFKFKQFLEYNDAMEWFANSVIDSQSTSEPMQMAS